MCGKLAAVRDQVANKCDTRGNGGQRVTFLCRVKARTMPEKRGAHDTDQALKVISPGADGPANAMQWWVYAPIDMGRRAGLYEQMV